jgi:uncharacterized membrane protein (UPF0127 family)
MNNFKKMDKGFVVINGNRFQAALAIDEQEQTNGLMHAPPPLTTMAFVYPKPQINKFWMKNVQDDLDILFCYKGKIIEIVKAEAMSTRLVGKDQYSDLVIEFPVHISQKYAFKIGDDVKMSLSKEAVGKILSS